MKKTVLSALVTVVALTFSGCTITQSKVGNSQVAKMQNADKYVVGKTTLEEVQDELGATMNIFEKENGETKYVWMYSEVNVKGGAGMFVPFAGSIYTSDHHNNTLALTFDKNSLLVKKKFSSGEYVDPDVAYQQRAVIQQYQRQYQ